VRFDPSTVPLRMRGRPVDHRGFPVPWFVTEKTEDGLWDFARVTPERYRTAIKRRLCWVSGEPMGRLMSFVIGPMCVVNRVAADPPVIPEIAKWSAKVCPFLSRPLAKRPDDGRPGYTPGIGIVDNPGMCAVWTTRSFELERTGLMIIGDPVEVTWWHQGRRATQDEIDTIFEARCDKLREIAASEGHNALYRFERQKAYAKEKYTRGQGTNDDYTQLSVNQE
jgi:hypothetical protein